MLHTRVQGADRSTSPDSTRAPARRTDVPPTRDLPPVSGSWKFGSKPRSSILVIFSTERC